MPALETGEGEGEGEGGRARERERERPHVRERAGRGNRKLGQPQRKHSRPRPCARIQQIQDSHGQILALAFGEKSLKPFKLFPLRSEAVTESICI